MEDALVRLHRNNKKKIGSKSLNPCFNGRCTRTPQTRNFLEFIAEVLILVLMEDALVPTTIPTFHLTSFVLILVLMEDALVQAFFLHYGVNVWVLILVLMEDALVPLQRLIH